MRVSFPCPSSKHPYGGISALYELANGLSRRGHVVNLLHGPFFGRTIESLDDLSWFEFDPAVHHRIVEGDRPDLPHADIWFGTGARPELGLPVLFVQGIRMFDAEIDAAALRTPCLKVCVARWLVEEAVLLGVPREQLVTIPIGIDHERFRSTVPLDERPPRVAILHHDHPAKGWPVGLAALVEARQRVPGLEAVAFGTIPPPDDLPAWIAYVHDPAPDVLVDEVYNGSRILLQASDYEGFGFTAVEAMACGCALVTTDNGGSWEYGLPGETALVAPPGDATALAAHVETLLRDDALRVALATRGRAHVRRFDWDLAAEALESHLERYLADPARYRRPPRSIDRPAAGTTGR